MAQLDVSFVALLALSHLYLSCIASKKHTDLTVSWLLLSRKPGLESFVPRVLGERAMPLTFFYPENEGHLRAPKTLCNKRPLTSHMRLREIGHITIGSRVSVFIPHSLGASSVRLRHGTPQKLPPNSTPTHTRNKYVPMTRSLNT